MPPISSRYTAVQSRRHPGLQYKVHLPHLPSRHWRVKVKPFIHKRSSLAANVQATTASSSQTSSSCAHPAWRMGGEKEIVHGIDLERLLEPASMPCHRPRPSSRPLPYPCPSQHPFESFRQNARDQPPAKTARRGRLERAGIRWFQAEGVVLCSSSKLVWCGAPTTGSSLMRV